MPTNIKWQDCDSLHEWIAKVLIRQIEMALYDRQAAEPILKNEEAYPTKMGNTPTTFSKSAARKQNKHGLPYLRRILFVKFVLVGKPMR